MCNSGKYINKTNQALEERIHPPKISKTSCRREAAIICPAPLTLTFDLLTSKVVSESRVTWSTFVPILVFLGLSILDLGPMYATDVIQTDKCQTDINQSDRQTDRQTSDRINDPA